MALIPALVAVGVVLARPESRGTARVFFIGILLSVVTLQLPLVLRSQERHGLVPYALTIVGQGSSVDVPGEALARNVFVSYALAHQVAFNAPPLPETDFWLAVNPLPGALLDTEASDATHRVNLFTPYSLVGELKNYGLTYFVIFFGVAGALLSYADRRIRALLAAGQELWAVALFGFGAMFAVVSLQYPARSATRFLFYVVLVDLFSRAALRLWAKGRKPSRHTAGVAEPPRKPRALHGSTSSVR